MAVGARKLSAYFVSNPSPIQISRTNVSTPIDADDENHENINVPPNLIHQNPVNEQQQKNQQQIPLWWFSSQASPFLMQQPQNIVVE